MTEPRDVTDDGETAPADDPAETSVAGQSAGADAEGEGDSEGGNLEDMA